MSRKTAPRLMPRYGFIVSRGSNKAAFLKFSEIYNSLEAAKNAMRGLHFGDGAGYPLMAIAKLTPFAEVPLTGKEDALPPFPSDRLVTSVVYSKDPAQIKGWNCFYRGYNEIRETWSGGPLMDRRAKVAACRVAVVEVLRGERTYFTKLDNVSFYEPLPAAKSV